MEKITLQELEQKLMGQTPEEVIQIIGKKPDNAGQLSTPDIMSFTYREMIDEPYSKTKNSIS